MHEIKELHYAEAVSILNSTGYFYGDLGWEMAELLEMPINHISKPMLSEVGTVQMNLILAEDRGQQERQVAAMNRLAKDGLVEIIKPFIVDRSGTVNIYITKVIEAASLIKLLA